MAKEERIDAYYEVTVNCKEETGYNQKKQQPIYNKFTEVYLIHAGSCSEAEQITLKKLEGFTWETQIKNIKVSRITDVFI